MRPGLGANQRGSTGSVYVYIYIYVHMKTKGITFLEPLASLLYL